LHLQQRFCLFSFGSESLSITWVCCISFIKKPVEEELSSAAAGAAAYLCFVLLQNADSCTVSVLISCAMMLIPGATNTVASYVQIPPLFPFSLYAAQC
jgi:hypothetical protein